MVAGIRPRRFRRLGDARSGAFARRARSHPQVARRYGRGRSGPRRRHRDLVTGAAARWRRPPPRAAVADRHRRGARRRSGCGRRHARGGGGALMAEGRRMRRGTLIGLVAAGAVVASVIGVSVVWPGLDAQETPDVDTAVWALQTGEGRRYARVNTSVGELDTVRSISNPDQVVQTGDGAYLFSDSYSTLTRIDAAMPTDLDEEALQSSQKTPSGTTEVVTAGDWVAYLTDSGAVFAGRLSSGTSSQLDPFGADDEVLPQYPAEAIAVDERGMLFAYSGADGSVLRYDIGESQVRARDAFDQNGIDTPAITAAGDTWAVVDTEDGEVWLRGQDAAAQAPTTGAVVVGAPDAQGTAVYLADEA